MAVVVLEERKEGGTSKPVWALTTPSLPCSDLSLEKLRTKSLKGVLRSCHQSASDCRGTSAGFLGSAMTGLRIGGIAFFTDIDAEVSVDVVLDLEFGLVPDSRRRLSCSTGTRGRGCLSLSF